MQPTNSLQQPSAELDGREAVDRNTVLVATTFAHPAQCGERVRSIHPTCQAALEPYNAAERFIGRWGTIIYLCRCGEAWREIAA